MNRLRVRIAAACLSLIFIAPTYADPVAPWGRAQLTNIDYGPQKVVFDVTTGDQAELSNILDRVSMLNNFYASNPLDARITLVLHGESIPFFALRNYEKYKALVARAEGLTHGEIVEFRLCRAAAKARYHLDAADFHGFIKVVPMADAEIIRLQNDEGYAYMR